MIVSTRVSLLFLHGFPYLSPCPTEVLKQHRSIQLLLSPLTASIKICLLATMIFCASLTPVFFNSRLMNKLPSGVKCLWMQSMHPVIANLTGDLILKNSIPLTLYIILISSAQLPQNNYEPTYRKKLKDDIKNSIELDKTLLIDSLSPNSTPSCFKYLRSFSLNHLPDQMHWKHIKASTNIHFANLFNFNFSSVYKTSNATILPIAENSQVILQDMTVEISIVEALLSSASSNCSSSDPILTFVSNFCPGLLAPLVGHPAF